MTALAPVALLLSVPLALLVAAKSRAHPKLGGNGCRDGKMLHGASRLFWGADSAPRDSGQRHVLAAQPFGQALGQAIDGAVNRQLRVGTNAGGEDGAVVDR